MPVSPVQGVLILILFPGGEVSNGPKIVGGFFVQNWKYPWFVALVKPSSVYGLTSLVVSCGASLVTKNKLLTAAHCYTESLMNDNTPSPSKFSALFYLTDRCLKRYREIVGISDVIIHNGWSRISMRNDLAVVILKKTVQYTPIPLAPPGGNGRLRAFILGFGDTVNGAFSQSCYIMEANLKIFTRRECIKSNIGAVVQQLPGVICAGARLGGRDSCQGDSGGPLIRLNSEGIYVLQGITSFGNGCGLFNNPGAYTNVSYYYDWLRNII